MVDYTRLRRFRPYVVWSKEAVDLWNKAFGIYLKIKRTKKFTEDEAREIVADIAYLRRKCFDLRKRVGRFLLVPVDKQFIKKARTSKLVPYYLKEGFTFDEVIGSALSILADARKMLSKKVWEYIGVSTRGFDIYYNPFEEIYEEIHPHTGEIVERSEAVKIIYTASIKTRGGHEPFVAEITGEIVVSKKDLEDIRKIEQLIEQSIKAKIRDEYDTPKIELTKKDGKPRRLLSDLILKEGIEFEISYRSETGELYGVIERKEPRNRKSTRQFTLKLWL